MKLTFLGTGTSQGVPVIGCGCSVCKSLNFQDKRLRTSAWIEIDDHHLILDTGPDFRQQALRQKIPAVNAVLYTHAHRDHIAGMDDLRSYNFLQNQEVPVYGNQQTIQCLQKEFDYVFEASPYPGAPRIKPNIISKDQFYAATIAIITIHALHGRMPVLGYRIADVAYITDVNHIPEQEYKKLTGLKVLILSALQLKPHHSHFTLDEAVKVAQKIGAEATYFTHISHNLGLHARIQAQLPDHIKLAYDGLQIRP